MKVVTLAKKKISFKLRVLARTAGEFRDELNPCQLSNITSRDINKIEFHKEFAIRNSHHLAIHLNSMFYLIYYKKESCAFIT
jgi:hypothetical protein